MEVDFMVEFVELIGGRMDSAAKTNLESSGSQFRPALVVSVFLERSGEPMELEEQAR